MFKTTNYLQYIYIYIYICYTFILKYCKVEPNNQKEIQTNLKIQHHNNKLPSWLNHVYEILWNNNALAFELVNKL
jgi:hypothetical protein